MSSENTTNTVTQDKNENFKYQKNCDILELTAGEM